MWILYAFLSALFAGITAIFAKIGIKNVDSHLATALRTIVIVVFAWLMVFLVGSQNTIVKLEPRSLLFLIFSGFSTGASWLCYFKALQLGEVNKVVPIDKSSTVLTMLLAFLFLGEKITLNKVIGMFVIAFGTYLMIQKKATETKKIKNQLWIVYAFLSAIFAALTSILGKIGIEDVESNLGMAIRTVVVLLMAWIIVFSQGTYKKIKNIDKNSGVFIVLSGFATGLSWLFYYKALQEGEVGVVVPIDKLSILVTIIFSYIFLKEKLSKRAIIGLIAIICGTMTLLVNF